MTILRLYYLLSIFSLLFQTSCKKFVQIAPPITSTNGENVYKDESTANAVLMGLYTKMSLGDLTFTYLKSLNYYPSLSADELKLFDGVSDQRAIHHFDSDLSPNTNGFEYWTVLYNFVFTCNAAIEGLQDAKALAPNLKSQLLGEARFIRAFCYFYLTNLYGDVPLAITSDYKVNKLLPRSPQADVYKQIIADLEDAKNLLSEEYKSGDGLSASTERTRVNKFGAAALLARAYLYTSQWQKAENEAAQVIGAIGLYGLDNLADVFLANSSETIWQLQPLGLGWNTEEAKLFILSPNGIDPQIHPVYLNESLVASFESNDQRKIQWTSFITDTIPDPDVNYYFSYKYKNATQGDPVSEYETVLRLSELYLIRAEARVQEGKIGEAREDINVVRNRAGLSDTEANNVDELLTAIEHERRVELFTEWGHRWFDLKRLRSTTNPSLLRVDEALSIEKGTKWQSTDKWYPIANQEIGRNPFLTQNAGY